MTYRIKKTTYISTTQRECMDLGDTQSQLYNPQSPGYRSVHSTPHISLWKKYTSVSMGSLGNTYFGFGLNHKKKLKM